MAAYTSPFEGDGGAGLGDLTAAIARALRERGLSDAGWPWLSCLRSRWPSSVRCLLCADFCFWTGVASLAA